MREEAFSLRKGAVYALASTVVGGGLWLLTLGLAAPAEERFSHSWWIAAGIGTFFWLAVGFIIGAFGPPGSADPSPSDPERTPAASGLKHLLALLGLVVYRVLVGWLVAIIVTGIYLGLLLGLGFVLQGHLDFLRGTSLGFVVMSGVAASDTGGLFGAVFGSLFAPRDSRAERRAVLKSAFVGNLLGIVLAGNIGAVVGNILDSVYGQGALEKKLGEDYVLVPMAIGGFVGICAGALAGVWLRLSQGKRAG